MQIKKYNVSKPKKYTDKEGVEKTQWNNIGVMTEFHKPDGSVSRIIDIPAIGLEANIFPFQDKKSQPNTENSAPQQQEKHEDYGMNDDVNPDDIPF